MVTIKFETPEQMDLWVEKNVTNPAVKKVYKGMTGHLNPQTGKREFRKSRQAPYMDDGITLAALPVPSVWQKSS